MIPLDRLGDIAAIPFFLAGFIYFLRIARRSIFETVLLLFCATGFIADIFFTKRYFLGDTD
jgi:hypothetical protein